MRPNLHPEPGSTIVRASLVAAYTAVAPLPAVTVHQDSPNGDSRGATRVHGNSRVTDGPKAHRDVDHLFRKAIAPLPNPVWIATLCRHPRVVREPIGGESTKGTEPGDRLAPADICGIVCRLDAVDQQLQDVACQVLALYEFVHDDRGTDDLVRAHESCDSLDERLAVATIYE